MMGLADADRVLGSLVLLPLIVVVVVDEKGKIVLRNL